MAKKKEAEVILDVDIVEDAEAAVDALLAQVKTKPVNIKVSVPSIVEDRGLASPEGLDD